MMPHVSLVRGLPVRLSPEVADALAAGAAVVALESTLLAHGLPAPDNRVVAEELEGIVRAAGAVPATVAVLDGVARVGLDSAGLDRVCAGGLAKLSRRDLPVALGLRSSGATTVASTAVLARAAGITVFATGGLGGVHRGARDSWDVSADLAVLAETPVLVVCSGVKSILDVTATLELLETLSVPVLGYRSDAFPGFYRRHSGHPAPWRVDTVEQVVDIMCVQQAWGAGAGVVLGNPIPAADEMDADLHERLLVDGLAAVAASGVTGKDVTPAVLDYLHTASGGVSLACNIALVRSNVALGAELAVELSRR